MENVYMILQQIYSPNCMLNFIRIAQLL